MRTTNEIQKDMLDMVRDCGEHKRSTTEMMTKKILVNGNMASREIPVEVTEYYTIDKLTIEEAFAFLCNADWLTYHNLKIELMSATLAEQYTEMMND